MATVLDCKRTARALALGLAVEKVKKEAAREGVNPSRAAIVQEAYAILSNATDATELNKLTAENPKHNLSRQWIAKRDSRFASVWCVLLTLELMEERNQNFYTTRKDSKEDRLSDLADYYANTYDGTTWHDE